MKKKLSSVEKKLVQLVSSHKYKKDEMIDNYYHIRNLYNIWEDIMNCRVLIWIGLITLFLEGVFIWGLMNIEIRMLSFICALFVGAFTYINIVLLYLAFFNLKIYFTIQWYIKDRKVWKKNFELVNQLRDLANSIK